MIRVLVVDDHPAMRLGVQRIFSRDASDLAMEEASSGPEALDRLRGGSYNLVLLDLVMPGHSGFELLSELKTLRPELPVLIFSMHTDEPFVVRALKEGAAGYITKDCPPDELIRAVRRVAAGGHYIMAELSGVLIDHLQSPDDRPLHEHLSPREFEVLRLLARGTHLREIARQLYVSESTVSTYRTRILQKLHLENNAQLTRYTLDNGLD